MFTYFVITRTATLINGSGASVYYTLYVEQQKAFTGVQLRSIFPRYFVELELVAYRLFL